LKGARTPETTRNEPQSFGSAIVFPRKIGVLDDHLLFSELALTEVQVSRASRIARK
jgi:hypothetical protein